MKTMTTEEKLDLAIDFIKSIEQYEPAYDYNDDCSPYIGKDEIDKLKDKAWHILADLT